MKHTISFDRSMHIAMLIHMHTCKPVNMHSHMIYYMYNTGIGLVRKHATTGTLSQTTDARRHARWNAGTHAARQSARQSVATASKLPASSVTTTIATTTTVATAPALLKRATRARPQTAHYLTATQCAGTGVYVFKYSLLCLRVCLFTCMHACVHACMHTYIHACVHAYMHTSNLSVSAAAGMLHKLSACPARDCNCCPLAHSSGKCAGTRQGKHEGTRYLQSSDSPPVLTSIRAYMHTCIQAASTALERACVFLDSDGEASLPKTDHSFLTCVERDLS